MAEYSTSNVHVAKTSFAKDSSSEKFTYSKTVGVADTTDTLEIATTRGGVVWGGVFLNICTTGN